MEYDLFLKEDSAIKDPVQLNEELYNLYSSGARSQWEDSVNDDWEVYNGKIWSKEDAAIVKARQQPVYEINLIRPGIQRLVSQIVSNKPSFRAIPREQSDIEMASAVCALGSYIWDRNYGNQKLAKGVEDFEVSGMMVLHGCTYDGDFEISLLDNRDVYIDPNSKEEDASDAAHIIISTVATKEQIQEKYPDFDFEGAQTTVESKGSNARFDDNNRTTYLNDTIHKKYRIIDRYSKIKVSSFIVYDDNTGWEKTLTKEEFAEYVKQPIFIRTVVNQGQPLVIIRPQDIQYAQNIIAQFGNRFSAVITEQGIVEVPFQGEGFELTPTTVGDAIKANLLKLKKIDETRIQRFMTIGKKFYYEGIMPTDKYPFGIAMLHHNRNPYPYGDIRLVKDLQYQANKTESLLTAHQANATNIKVIVGRGQDVTEIENKFAKAGAAVIQVDFELGEPIIVHPIPMPNELYKNLADKKQQIEDILGTYAFQWGDANSAPETFRGTLALDEMGQRGSTTKRAKIIHAINRLFAWISDMIPHVYTQQKMIRILMPNHADPQTFVFNEPKRNGIIMEILNDLTVNKFDLVIADDSLMLNNKIAKAQLLTEWYQSGIIKDNVPILLASGLPGVDEIIKRQDIIVQLQQQLAQAMQEIKRLQGDLQTATRAEVEAEKKVEVHKFKTDLAKAANKIEASVQLAQQRLTDFTKEKKKEKNNG